MGIFTLERSRWAYRADFALYSVSILVMALWLVSSACAHLLASSGLVLLGLLAWSWLEYALHRFVLHGLPPFAAWHQLHHQRPRALICAPTLFSGGLIGLLVFAPALLLSGLWQACALTLGVLLGYLAYSWIHHLAHHGHVDARWLRRRQHWHALHHRRAAAEQRACYGVSTAFWDHVFGTLPRRP